jgi:Ca2+-binding EF-hand superfamily protein
VGVEFDVPVHKGHDGTVDGVAVFRGNPGHCLLVNAASLSLEEYSQRSHAAHVISAAAKGALTRANVQADILADFLKTLENYNETRMNRARAQQAARGLLRADTRQATLARMKILASPALVFDHKALVAPPLPEGAFPMPLSPTAVESMLAGFRSGLVPHPSVALTIFREAHALCRTLPNGHSMQVLEGERLTVVGDLHGHLEDLFFILQCNGPPSRTNKYIFNGDLVDRGHASVEVVLTLFSLLLLHGPGIVSIARGNHEDADQNRMYAGSGGKYGHDVGFHLDCDWKYGTEDGPNVYDACIQVFHTLPLFHIVQAPRVNKKAFVVHGGLFMEPKVTLSMLQRIHRFRPVPVGSACLDDSLFVQTMWADPRDIPGSSMNDARGDIPCVFGESVTREFLDINGLDMVVRSHEAEMLGHRRWHGGKLVTVFSASGYMNVRRGARAASNKGAILVFNEDFGSRVDTFSAPSLDRTSPQAVAREAARPLEEWWEASRADREMAAEQDVVFSLEQAGAADPPFAGAASLVTSGSLPASSLKPPPASSKPRTPPPPPPLTVRHSAPVKHGSTAALRLAMPNRSEGAEALADAASAEAVALTRADSDFEWARQVVVDAIIERKTDLYWCYSTADPAHTGYVSLDEWSRGMQLSMPFKAKSWRHINASFDLVDVEHSDGDDAAACINYCRFLDRYVGDITPQDHSVQKQVMRSIAKRLFETVAEPSLEAVFRALDTNGDGVVDFAEFVSGLEAAGCGLTRSQLVLLMHAVDTSMDGTVSLEEFENAFEFHFEPRGREDLAKTVDPETLACLTRVARLILRSGANVRDLFESMDTDSDGSLSLDEIASVFSKLHMDPPLSEGQIASIFRLIDEDNSGSVSIDEFCGAFSVDIAPSSAAPRPPATRPPPAKRGSVVLPSVGPDNRIDFLGAIFSDIAIRLKAHTGQLGVAFRLFDTDRDGRLSTDEFRRALDAVGLDLEPSIVETVIECIDADHDGTISPQEFIDALTSRDLDREPSASTATASAVETGEPPAVEQPMVGSRRRSLFSWRPWKHS